MWQKQCRLTIADKFFGGGGSSISVPSLGQEIGDVTKGFNKNIYPTFQKFTQNEPLLQELSSYGLQASRQLQPYVSYGLQNAQAIQPYIQDVLSHPYSVPRELLNYATQGARGAFQSRGNLDSGAALAGELMNREGVREQRIASTLGLAQQSQGLLQGSGALAGQAESLLGYPEQQRTGNFATLMNPLYGLAAAQLGAQTQANIASAEAQSQGKAGTGSLIGSGIGAIGTAVGGIAM